MRPALEHAARNSDVGLVGIEALGATPVARIAGNAVGLLRGVWAVVVRCPFPYVADLVEKAETVGREASHWRGPLEGLEPDGPGEGIAAPIVRIEPDGLDEGSAAPLALIEPGGLDEGSAAPLARVSLFDREL